MEIVKLRRLGSSVVVTLPQSILAETGLVAGDRVILCTPWWAKSTPAGPKTVIITRETEDLVRRLTSGQENDPGKS